MRAVLSARSMNPPACAKAKPSVRINVPSRAPRDWFELCLIDCRKEGSLLPKIWRGWTCENSGHVPLRLSHMSVVISVRTDLALVRALNRHDFTDEGLSVSNSM